MSKTDLQEGDYSESINEIRGRIAKEISRRNAKIDALIKEALIFVYGKDFKIEKLAKRGQVNCYKGGSLQFVMDGKVLLEFHKLQYTEIFFREYKKIKNDFNECLPEGENVKSEIL